MLDDTPAPPEPRLNAAGFQKITGASDAAVADLQRYRERLEAGAAVMNLVGPATLPDFWRRHALDSAQLELMAPEARVWADLGSGAGLPGVVLAILLKGQAGARVHLVDSLKKRTRFLQGVVQALELPAEVHDARAESLAFRVDVVTARALAPLPRLLGWAEPWLRQGATGLFLKGESVEDELDEARQAWRFDADLLPSLSDPRGRILKVRSLKRAHG